MVGSPVWGYGKVDAYNALAAVQAALPRLSWWVEASQQVVVTVQPTIPGRDYVLEASADLLGWLPALTNTATAGLLQMLDPGPRGPQRFYRVVQPPQ